MSEIFDPNSAAQELESKIRKKLLTLPKLHLASIALGKDSSCMVYRSSQKKLALDLGIVYHPLDFSKDIELSELSARVKELNKNPEITGIIINKPFINDWKEEEVFSLIDVDKDVEGVNPLNLGRLLMLDFSLKDFVEAGSLPVCLPPTLRSILHALFLSSGENVRSKRVTIVGFTSIIGKPLAFILANALATVSIVHIGTSEAGDLPDYIKAADIVISAAGVPSLIKGEWIKQGAVVIDVGTGKKENRLCGDIEFKTAKDRASFISPSPGGIGILTPLYLFSNLILLAEKRRKK
ncbi:MAG: bifunctional 5,10-methylenetetrahydrofolate dehydrogenase/5,10-methenyltetrahydrofolate cyclohydrolase [Candidatus Omnitrophica bacterium]|nr:bifunctional 5,10-methylenetetrahydrofolate dehydrogenase/5,10-methenyltetrahydrofolate cyclohydrolase [Candidatus Omnitrophota bacterium]